MVSDLNVKKKLDKDECRKLIQECESILEKLDRLKAEYDSFSPEMKELVAEKLSEMMPEEGEWN